jgi:hypothetical protein
MQRPSGWGRLKQWVDIHEDLEFFYFISFKLDNIATRKRYDMPGMTDVSDLHLTNHRVGLRLPDVEDAVMKTFTGIDESLGGISDLLGGIYRREVAKLVMALISIELNEIIDIQGFAGEEHLFNDVHSLAAKLGPLFGVWPFPFVAC